MSEIELIYWFLKEYEAFNSAIFKDGSQYAAICHPNESDGGLYANGETIGDAIRNWKEEYEQGIKAS